MTTIPWYLWGILANFCIAFVEYTNRTTQAESFARVLPWTLVPILIAQLGLFYSWRYAPSMMLAWAVLTVGNTLIRLVSVQWAVGEPPSSVTLLGVGVMLLGALLVKVGS